LKTFLSKNGIGSYAVFVSLFLLLLTGCATYYQKNEALMSAVYNSNFESANKILSDDVKWEKVKRNRLLFYLNKGTVLWMQGDYVTSNAYFRKADYFVEDYNLKMGDAVMTMLVNAKMATYGGESFEQILLHYYGALNYLALDQPDEALIEGKRMLEKMQKITDKYGNKNKYKRDAFAHNLIGLIYDLKGEYNDAFISYRNAYEVYKTDYISQFGTNVPLQLKKDLIRTAKAIGFYEEQHAYETEFNLKAEDLDKEKGSVLFFWNNGLGPIKDEFSINVTIIDYGNGWVQFVNPEFGISIPYRVENKDQHKDMLAMKIIRLALPKYITRNPLYARALLQSATKQTPFELTENINAIAYKSLADRMGKELAVGLMRVALKQLAVYTAQQNKDQQGLAAAAMLYSAISEQADTRNWQLLPYSINYARMQLDTGNQKIDFMAYNTDNQLGAQKSFDLNIPKGKTKVLSIQTLEFAGFSGN